MFKKTDNTDLFIRYALGKSYTIYFFLGDVPDSVPVDGYTTHASYVGAVATFSSKQQCANCEKQKAQKVLSKAQVPLTGALLQRAKDEENHSLYSLEPEGVNSYLVQKLSWKVVKVGPNLVYELCWPRWHDSLTDRDRYLAS